MAGPLIWRTACLFGTLVMLAGCATSPVRPIPEPPPPRPSAPPTSLVGWEQVGDASWYGAYHQGRRTANGERYDMRDMTAAHRTLPFGTLVRVTNLDNDRSVDVRINDRGPHLDGRIIDLSRAAARRLGAVGDGVVPVRLRVLAVPETTARER